jgi:hypothetical protein
MVYSEWILVVDLQYSLIPYAAIEICAVVMSGTREVTKFMLTLPLNLVLRKLR